MKQFSTYLFAFLLAFGVHSCKNDSAGLDNELSTIEKAFYKNQNWEAYNLLINQIKQRIDKHKDNPKVRRELYLMGWKAAEKMRAFPDALGFQVNLVKDFPEDEDTPNRLFHLGELYGGLDKREAMTVIMAGLKEHYTGTEAAGKAKKNLTSDFPGLQEYMTLLRQRVFNDSTTNNKTWIKTFVEASEAYALVMPKDTTKSPYFLHQAAEASRSMGAFDRALLFYDWIIEKYPQSPKAAQSLFLKAFTYDNNKKDIANARKFYNEFLEKYPNDPFADDTKFLLNNLGKSDEEILEELTKKQQKKK